MSNDLCRFKRIKPDYKQIMLYWTIKVNHIIFLEKIYFS